MDSTMASNINYKTSTQVKRVTSLKYQNLFWLFMVGSVIGFVLEGLWMLFRAGYWENHSAVIWGPFCIIYGFGVVAVYIISHLLSGRNLFLQFIAFFISGALVEYFGSLFQEMLLGSTSWDYSEHFLNIGGRVSLQMSLIWGVLGILFMRFFFPLLKRMFEKPSGKKGVLICGILTVVMILNLSITSVVVMRWQNRLNGAEPKNNIEQLIDNTYGNEKMDQLFTNMQFINK